MGGQSPVRKQKKFSRRILRSPMFDERPDDGGTFPVENSLLPFPGTATVIRVALAYLY